MKNNFLRSFLCIVIIVFMTFGLVACGEQAENTAPASPAQSGTPATDSVTGSANTDSVSNGTNSASQTNSVSSGTQTPTTQTNAKLIKEYLSAVVSTTEQSPYSYIPEKMRRDNSSKFVTETAVSYDFTNFTPVSNIKYGGFGEQWNMVLDNITQSQRFYNYLNIGESAVAASVTLMNVFLDNATTDVSAHEEENEKFKAVLTYSNNTLHYVVTYKTDLQLPLFGSVKPVIDMTFSVSTNKKTVLVTLTDTNAMRYTVTDNTYEFGIEYGVDSVNRSAYCLLTRNSNGTVEGHIYEYITVKGKDAVKSCADFYIGTDYVSVVGNKASGMIGFSGYINELYKVNEGKLLGYEVQETLTIAGVSGTYNTLWFNLSDISGITSVKVTNKTDTNQSSKSTVDVYLNGSSTLFVPAYNTKLTVKTSRKHDIELRTQYFYGKDASGDIVEYKTTVPMMFIQQDNDKDTNFTDYPSDMLKNNGITSTVTLNKTYLNKIMSDYATLIEVFKTNKELVDSELIKSYINS